MVWNANKSSRAGKMVLKFYLQTVKSYGYFVATIMHFKNILELISKVSFFSFTSLQTIFLICQLTRNNFQKLLFVCEKIENSSTNPWEEIGYKYDVSF